MACNRYDQEDSKKEWYVYFEYHLIDIPYGGPYTLEEAERVQQTLLKDSKEARPIIIKKPH